jgi:2-furoyl-CoA dehydrogenase large subunit
MSTPPCIANAVADALGVADLTLPLTPSKVMDLIGADEPPPSKAVAQALAPTPRVAPVAGGDAIPSTAAVGAVQAGKAGKGGKSLGARGEVVLDATPEAVFRVLLDPAALAKVIPGCNALEPNGEHRYRADVTVGVGMIKARYSAEVALSELDPPRSLRLAGSGLSSVGSARGSGLVTLEPKDGGTLLHYDYTAEVSGKVAAVGSRMLEGAAKIVLNQLFEQLGREAGGQRGASGGAAPAATSATQQRSLWQRLKALFGVKA